MRNETTIPESVSKKRFVVGMVIFDDMTNLDLVGPMDALARIPAVDIKLIAQSSELITTDSGCRVVPDVTFVDAPSLDMLFIPGGPGINKLLLDENTLGFLKKAGTSADWVTSVCTGALALGAAGLLKGYKATTHWTCRDLLPIVGAEPVNERVVIDRNRITGGGVTAGIDFALYLIAHLWGKDRAQMIQLGQEYNPAPPFNSGSPDTAPDNIVEKFLKVSERNTKARKEALLSLNQVG
ncbi:DJ-1/PfpI family protein [Parasphingorhabdus cellanae]|uniref:DJ-1/PfpI family protein n=1 Tax=Parasphingorhabdus cellanae TaxID=2806553 RepID=A0ABX7T2N6_9SPHN|nr:DJ-1/PfpI family protein [Parasphingorhabdus cellanae]QTD55821.1 DJ-1/PfpI family protein [Parasphingorhabdus cellanae]